MIEKETTGREGNLEKIKVVVCHISLQETNSLVFVGVMYFLK